MTKKFLFLTLCLFILGTFISACGGSGKTTPPDNSAYYYLLAQQNNNNQQDNNQEQNNQEQNNQEQNNQEQNNQEQNNNEQQVDPALPSLEVNPKEIYVVVDEEDNIVVTLEGKVVTEDVTYKSDDESIATVDKGTVKGLRVGTTNITVSLEGANSAVFEVNIVENPFKEAQKGDEVEFGRYPQTAEGEVQPIKWLVLSRDDENKQLLAISVDGLDALRFDDDSDGSTTNVWEKSVIRGWLNGDGFYNRVLEDETAVFTDGEKSLIKPVVLADVYMTEPDNVFLLSKKEAEDYFADDSARMCKATEYAKADGARISTSGSYAGNCSWWLRSPSPNFTNRVYYVVGDGANLFDNVDNTNNSVRPALWINL